eukprot:754822-Hanusia_phi.AAC.1
MLLVSLKADPGRTRSGEGRVQAQILMHMLPSLGRLRPSHHRLPDLLLLRRARVCRPSVPGLAIRSSCCGDRIRRKIRRGGERSGERRGGQGEGREGDLV